MQYANNKGADPRSLISDFVVRCLDSITPLVSGMSSLKLVSVAKQAGLCLTWSQLPEDMFSHGPAQIKMLCSGKNIFNLQFAIIK